MERLFFFLMLVAFSVTGILTAVRVYVWHDYEIYTDIDEIPDQVYDFEQQYLPFLPHVQEASEEMEAVVEDEMNNEIMGEELPSKTEDAPTDETTEGAEAPAETTEPLAPKEEGVAPTE